AALWDGAALQALGEVATPAADRAGFVRAIAGFATGRTLRGVAVSIAGVVDPATGIGKVANIPAIDGLALAPALEDLTGCPVLVLNDADCFAMAEARMGAGRGHPTVFGVILGSGVGGGLVIDGRPVSGAGGYAGEWGHGPVIRGDYAFPCGCGQTGCVDTVGGARGLERLHLTRTGEALQSQQIVQRWQAGDVVAKATMALWRDLVVGPLAMVLNVVGAGSVPVGGGLSRAPGLVAYLDEALRGAILRTTHTALAVPAECGADAGLLGAAMAGEAAWG
ncbi:MAG: ROK family protein, partial [Tabrizicola sp.]|nr:ROK family protein [Tabrizicola sp.]